MQSVKVSTTKLNRLTISLNLEALQLPWNMKDNIRVFAYKSDGRLILQRVGKKIDKNIIYTLTSNGGNSLTHQHCINIRHTNRRFKKDFSQQKSTFAAVRKLDNDKLEVYLPPEIYSES